MFNGLSDINFGAVEQDSMLQQEAQKAINIAKAGTIALVSLQAVAAFAALGVFIIQAKMYCDRKHGRTRTRTRSSRRTVRRIAR